MGSEMALAKGKMGEKKSISPVKDATELELGLCGDGHRQGKYGGWGEMGTGEINIASEVYPVTKKVHGVLVWN